MSTDSLQAAARKFASLIAPDITRIVLHGPAGKSVSIAIPKGESTPPTVATLTPSTLEPPSPAPTPGWDFSHPVARFDGSPVPIHGRKRDLLKLLASSPIPLKVPELKVAWNPPDPEDGTVRWFLGDLRRALKALFTELEDPISTTPAGYVLTIR